MSHSHVGRCRSMSHRELRFPWKSALFELHVGERTRLESAAQFSWEHPLALRLRCPLIRRHTTARPRHSPWPPRRCNPHRDRTQRAHSPPANDVKSTRSSLAFRVPGFCFSQNEPLSTSSSSQQQNHLHPYFSARFQQK